MRSLQDKYKMTPVLIPVVLLIIRHNLEVITAVVRNKIQQFNLSKSDRIKLF